MLEVKTEGKPLAVLQVTADYDGLRIKCQNATNAAEWYVILLPLDTLQEAITSILIAQDTSDWPELPLLSLPPLPPTLG